VPVGKMHTDRYIPLHPQLKSLLDDWLSQRVEGLRSDLLFVDRGRPITEGRVEQAVARAARTGGLGRVTPHQLRHTLATQAKVRGIAPDTSFGRADERARPATWCFVTAAPAFGPAPRHAA
jgi:integrase